MAVLRDLAARMLDGRLELQRLDELSDAEVRSQLVAVRGIGPWTADLFLIGQLGREDVLPSADLGLRHAVQAVYHLEHVPSPKEVDALGERWRPHRTLATAYLYEAIWRRGPQPPLTPAPDAWRMGAGTDTVGLPNGRVPDSEHLNIAPTDADVSILPPTRARPR